MTNIKFFLLSLLALVVAGCTSVNKIIENEVAGVVYIENKVSSDKMGMGTGFFIDENTIITNNHVIDGDGEIKVALESSSKLYEAEVVFKDAVADIAIIKLKDWRGFKENNKPIQYLKFATTIPTRTEDVYAIGNPWGLVWSVSKGIVSYPLRRSPEGKPVFYVQTDGDIFNGNSGGPLIDTDGNVVGINALMLAKEGGSYGLAIISELVIKIIEDQKAFGYIKWPSIGVIIEEGSVIKEVNEGSPAEKAGLKASDQIISINNGRGEYEVGDLNELLFRLVTSVTDQPVMLTIKRNDESITIEVLPRYRTSQELLAETQQK